MKFCGRNFLVELEDAGNPGQYLPIGGFTANDLTINNAQVDITDKQDAPNRTLLEGCGIRSIDVSGSGFFDDNAQTVEMQAAALLGVHKNLRITSEYGDEFLATFEVNTFTRGGPHDNAESMSVAIASSGPVTYNPPAPPPP